MTSIHMTTRFQLTATLLVALFFLACSDSDNAVCVPGEVQICPCVGGLEGVQSCNDDGKGWGACEQCTRVVGDDTETSTDADPVAQDTETETEPTVVDTDSDPPPVLGECEYAECEQEACENEDDCCLNTACNDWIFNDEDEYLETYCYPMCDEADGDDACKCGDECVTFGSLSLCLSPGGFQMDNLETPVGVDYESAIVVDLEEMEFSLSNGDDPVFIEIMRVYWDEWETDDGELRNDFVIVGQGDISSREAWFLWMVIPQDTFEQGAGVYTNEEARTFYGEFYHGLFNSDGYLTDLRRETVMDPLTSTLTIHQTCEPCPPPGGADAGIDAGSDTETSVADGGEAVDMDGGPGSDPCGLCRFSFDFSWYALRAKIHLSN